MAAGSGRLRLPVALLGAALLGLAALGAPAAAEPKAKPPPPGMAWEAGIDAALERSLREGRPLLVCVNALEDERANVRLATELYPSEAWGRSSRGFVCVVANPNEHDAREGRCARYGHAPCAGHQSTLAWVLKTFSPDGALISPQHLILEPDGAVAYRKEYFEGHEGPFLFETWLTRLAPRAAQRLARADRAARLEQLAKVPAKDVAAFAKAWLAEEDGLATLGVVAALEDATDPVRRAGLLDALGQAPPAQALGLVPWAEAFTAAPDEAPTEVHAWVEGLLKVDRRLGVWAAARALARSRQADLQALMLKTLGGTRGLAGLALLDAGERAALEEALRLAGAPVPAGLAPDDDQGTEQVPLLRRQRARARGTTGASPLPERLGDLAPGRLRAALLAAAPEDVLNRRADVEAFLRASPMRRVRLAAALALLVARVGAEGLVARELLDGLADVLEGPETRALAVARLGDDPGEDLAQWHQALAKHVGGGK